MTQDTPTLLFELEAQPAPAEAAVATGSTWAPPAPEPLPEPVPLPLLDEQADGAETGAAEAARVGAIPAGAPPIEADAAAVAVVEEDVAAVEVVEATTAGTTAVATPEATVVETAVSRTTVVAATAPHAEPVRIADALAELRIEVEEPSAPQRPLPEWARALGVFDLETTGVDTATARIVTAHVGLIDETGAVVERKDWIVDPGVPIPEGAAAVHGITDERARRFGRPPGEVVAEILAAIRSVFARGFPLVVYNAPYDLTLLSAEAERHRLWPLEVAAPVVDPLVLDKQIDRYRKGKRTLTAASEVYGVTLTEAHDAGADAIAAGRLAQAMARRFPEELELAAHELHEAQVGWCAEQAERFTAYMREKRDPDFTTSGAWPHR